MPNPNLKILAVDDIQDNLITLRAVVRDAFPDAAFMSTQSGEKCIDMALAEDPDVVLLDIVMPDMDGFEVCRRLKDDKRLRHIPVIFLTALQTDRESRIKALEAGGEAFLAKPLEETELTAQIRAMAKIKAAAVAQQKENDRLAELVAERTRELHLELALRQSTENELKQNIAALKTLNQNLEESQRQLLQSEKMASIGQLAAGIAHEINNPLSFVRSNFSSLAQYVNELLAVDAAYDEIERQYAAQLPQAFARVHQIKNEAEHGFIINDVRQLISESREGLERVNVIVQDIKDFSRMGETGWVWIHQIQGRGCLPVRRFAENPLHSGADQPGVHESAAECGAVD
jgi:two-component system, NtrC family, sensor kinase